MKNEEEFLAALKEKKVPVLVLDQKWHRLFALSGKTEEIRRLEEALSRLLESQGQMNNDIKELKKVKAKLMESIVENMDGTHEENVNDIASKKLEESRRLIDDVNEQIEEKEDALLDMPRLIADANRELMLESMNYCYGRLRDNSAEIEEIAEWITRIRIELKKNIVKKQNCEINNRQIYSYMHDIFGAQILDLFDLSQEDEEKYHEKKEKPEGE